MPGARPGSRARLAGAVAGAVDAVGGVRRSPGSGVEVATQYAGGKVTGVQLSDDRVVVHVVAEELPLPPLLERVHAAAERALAGSADRRRVQVVVDDIDVDGLPGGMT